MSTLGPVERKLARFAQDDRNSLVDRLGGFTDFVHHPWAEYDHVDDCCRHAVANGLLLETSVAVYGSTYVERRVLGQMGVGWPTVRR
jgi:hypothetical protein